MKVSAAQASSRDLGSYEARIQAAQATIEKLQGEMDSTRIAVERTEVRSPCDGVVTSLHRARHAVTLRADAGPEILMHIGLDTVGLKGEGFTARVAEGDRVTTGTPLIDFDMDVMAQLVRSLVVAQQ